MGSMVDRTATPKIKKIYSCTFRLHFICSGVILLVLCATTSSFCADKNSADITQVIAAAKELSAAKSNQSIDILKKLSRSKNKAVSYRAKKELATYYRKNGDLAKASGYVTDFQNPIGFKELHPAVATQFLRGVLEAAHIMVLNKDETRALQLLSWAEGLSDSFNKTLAQTKYAEILFDIDELERCRAYLKQAAKTYQGHLNDKNKAGSAIGQASKNLSNTSAWNELKKRSEIIKLKLKQKELEKKFGEDYGLYAYMRLCMSKGYYGHAKVTAERIFTDYPKSVFAQAARYIYGCCLVKDVKAQPDDRKRIKSAEDWFNKFIKEDPTGLYRGEAMLLLGKAYMETMWDAGASFKYYTKALDYFVAARERKNALNLYAPVKDNLKNYIRPTTELTTYDSWERTVWNAEDPLKMYNAATTPPWYVNEKELMCRLYVGFLYYYDGNVQKAQENWAKLATLDPKLEKMQTSVYKRLKCVIIDKQMVFTKKEKESFKDLATEIQLQLLYSEFLYIMEKFTDALSIADQILLHKKILKNQEAIAVVNTLKGQVNNTTPSIENKRQSWVEYLKVLKDGSIEDTPIYGQAFYLYASSLCGYHGQDFWGVERALPMFMEYVNKYSRKDRKYEKRLAHFQAIQCNILTNNFNIAKQILKDFPDVPEDHFKEYLTEELKIHLEKFKMKNIEMSKDN